MTTLATAVAVLAVVTVLAHGALLLVGPGHAARRAELNELGAVPFVALWVASAVLMMAVRGLSGERHLDRLLTDGDAWISALGVGFALAGAAFVATRWLLGTRPGQPTWNIPVASVLAGACAAVIGLSTLPF
ncbi:hypothetical protein [Kytococcus sp. Marseille-QA3725]